MNVTTPSASVPRELDAPTEPPKITPTVAPNPKTLTDEQRALLREAVEFSILVYGSLGEVVTALKAEGFGNVLPLDHWGMQGVCFANEERAYVVFRGTASFADWCVDGLCFPGPRTGQHYGFGRGWRALREDVMDWLQLLNQPHLPLFLTGHSLGGALAHVAGFDLARQGRPIAHIVTFGAPKFAYLGTGKLYNTQTANLAGETLGTITLNVVNERDLVARVPPRWIGYRDVGRPIQNEGGQWRFTDRVESVLLDSVFESMDFDGAPVQPLIPLLLRVKYPGSTVIPGLAHTSTPDPREKFKTIRNSFYNILPYLRLPVAYVLLICLIVRAAMDHPSALYRTGFFSKEENARFQVKPEPALGSIIFLLIAALSLAYPVLWVLYRLIWVVIEVMSRGNSAH